MVEVDNIVEVPGWAIDKVTSNGKKIQLVLSLDHDVIGDRASNVMRGLTVLQLDSCPTYVGVYSSNEDDETQSVLPQLSDNNSTEEGAIDGDASESSEDFIEVN